ncbi:MAG: RNA polymerase sigma factor [Opitutaceae bacterium]|nr:RNA polymerase sigma factor [Opitutaceae bacterium]
MNLDEIYRRDYGKILASLIRVVGDISLAEDSLQDAFAAAHVQWAAHPPPNPVAWLILTARHKAIDQLRRKTLAENRQHEIRMVSAPVEEAPEPVDTLRLMFTCCHPALAPEAQVALTLRTVGGLTTEEIARAFLVPVPTLAQRLVRAKTKIKVAGIAYEVPADDELAGRLEAVLACLYLVFNEGYSASFGPEVVRGDLCAQAIRLTRQLVELLPQEPEPKGLLALMLLNDARRLTRADAQGDIVLLEDQDRSRWDRDAIAEGVVRVEEAFSSSRPGPYTIQAAIAAAHAGAPRAADTDWRRIVLLYGLLARLQPSPVVELNRAVAIAMAEGPAVGLARLEAIDLPGYHLLPAIRADLLRRLGRFEEAATHYRQALEWVKNDAERRFLTRRLHEVTAQPR